jgi:hypothetical protein
MLGVRSVCLKPRQLDGDLLRSLRKLQPTLHKLYDAVARDVDFVSHAIRSRTPRCAWQEQELRVFQQTAARAAEKPRLLLPNSVFLQPCEHSSVLTVGNVQAGEPYQVEVLHDEVRQQRVARPQRVASGPLRAQCHALASAARLVHPNAPCVAILTKPRGALAQRTYTDVRGVGDTLLAAHGVQTVLYVSMGDLASAVVDADGSLRLGTHRISVVYSRYDFSHPFGAPLSDGEVAEAVGATGDDGDGDGSARNRLRELWQEWQTIVNMERSTAVVSSDLGCRLAHRRGVAHALERPGGVERFLSSPDEVAAVRAVLPEQWSLRAADRRSLQTARALVGADADGYVAKNVFRPRTGSGATQDRRASGGMLVAGAAQMRQLLDDERTREWYLLYRRLAPVTHRATIRHTDSSIHELQHAVSEIAVYGAYLTTPEESEPMINLSAGVAARTRPAMPVPVPVGAPAEDALSRALGYGALSCVAVASSAG